MRWERGAAAAAAGLARRSCWHALESCALALGGAGEGPEKAPGKTRQNCTSLSLRRRQTRCRAEFARRFQ
eukprot:scaffold8588_cov63-Phaeocystis_antarctica.AAC.2